MSLKITPTRIPGRTCSASGAATDRLRQCGGDRAALVGQPGHVNRFDDRDVEYVGQIEGQPRSAVGEGQPHVKSLRRKMTLRTLPAMGRD